MTSVQEATDIVLKNILNLPPVHVPLLQANGRILWEPIHADRDFPPFNRVTMDGIAISFASWTKGRRSFSIEGLQAAGMPQMTLHNPDNCLEVMTGAVLPENTDTVIPYEEVIIRNGVATVPDMDMIQGRNVHRQGSDKQKGSLLISPGIRLTPAEIAVAATVGKTTLQVSAVPRIALVSTGDELVGVEQIPLPHQIRRSNAYALHAALQEWGVQADLFHLIDTKEVLRDRLSQLLTQYDALILSGGVSKGKLDYVPEVLQELEVKQLFHRVQQRPGKPLWFGRSAGGKIVFALPGNPVSTFMCFYRYIQPWLVQSMGIQSAERVHARLAEDIAFKPSLTYFLQVRVRAENESLVVYPIAGKGSGDLANLVDADGFLELPADRETFQAGEVFPLYRYRKI